MVSDEKKEDSSISEMSFKKFSPPPGAPDALYCGECVVNHNPDRQHLTRSQLQLTHSWKSPHHSRVLESLLKNIDGVDKVIVDLELGCVYVDHTNDVNELTHALNQGGYPATVAATHEQTDLDRDEIMNNVDPEQQHIVKSTFFVQGICCASEVPSVRKIVKAMPGISTLQINIAMKRVYVDHDITVKAQNIASRLDSAGFPTQIVSDGGLEENEPIANTSVGRSTLHTQAVLHPQDVAPIQAKLLKHKGIKKIGVNVAESVVYVEHDIHEIKASELERILLPEYPSSLVQDAEADIQSRTNALLNQPRSKYVESTVQVSNLSVGHLPVLRKAISQNYIRAHIRAIHPYTANKILKVEHNPGLCNIDGVCQTLGQYGLHCSVISDGAEEGLLLPLVEEEEKDGDVIISDWERSQLHWNVALSGVFWLLSILSMLGAPDYLEYAGLFAVVFGLPPVVQKAFRTLRRFEFDANCMMVTAAVGALLLGEFDEAASVAFLFSISEYLESRATDRARKALSDIVQLKPEHANVIHPETKELVVVPATKVPVNTLVSVRTGDKVAADGIVVEGTSTIDESSLTGESIPVRKTIGDSISAGGINVGSTQLVVRTTCTVEDSAVSRLIRLVEEAQANRSATEKLIDNFARAYTPVVISLAILMCTVPWLFGSEAGRYWTLNGLIIVVIACPCALTISTPVTYAAGLAATAQKGIVVKGGAHLETLGGVNRIIFDKTGTLTEGKFVLSHLENIGQNRSREQMLGLLALMESPSSHPLSATLVKAAKIEGIRIPDIEMKDHTILKGEGVTAEIGEKQVWVGNERMFKRIGLYESLTEEQKRKTQDWSRTGGTVGFIGVAEEGIIGAYCVSDCVREEAKDVVSDLQFAGIRVMMLTGDSDNAAKAVAEQIGLSESAVHAELMPEDKLHFINGMKTPGVVGGSLNLFRRPPRVLFCGDGVNDGPALAVADIGVSMGDGAALALEMSDVTLMDSNLTKIIYMLKMGARVVSTIEENIVLSLACKALVITLTFFGYMTLFYAIASDVGVMLLVTMNGMKLLAKNPEDETSLFGDNRLVSKGYGQVSKGGMMSPTGVAELEVERLV